MMLRLILSVALLLTVSGCVALQRGPVGNVAVPQPARSVDLNQYLGRWYEIARYEAGFQRGCEAVTADYSLRDDGMIRVINSCRQNSVTGEARQSEGRARVVDTATGAKLKVSFFGPFWGDYWVLDRAEDYSWAIVGEPSGRYLWLLSRVPHPEPRVRSAIEARAAGLGYNLSLLRPTQQPR
ncbi:MAG: lipocalin family protein [Sphingopyxis sp.]|nr:lipocalin family protein [Sphingopyxis sp.]